MTYKAYIVANKEQELDVLKKLENNGFKWSVVETLPTKFRFSEAFSFKGFPYIIGVHEDIGWIGWSYYSDDYEGNVVYDGRKENKMKRYLVTEVFMNELIEWRDDWNLDVKTGMVYAFVDGNDIQNIRGIVDDWLTGDSDPVESNNRLIAIIQWLNGEDVFEVEEPHKFIVRSDVADEDGDYWYVSMDRDMSTMWYHFANATRFNTREEAQEWANSHQVVVEIDAEGNEVE